MPNENEKTSSSATGKGNAAAPNGPYCKRHPDSFNGFCGECLVVRVEMQAIARRLTQRAMTRATASLGKAQDG